MSDFGERLASAYPRSTIIETWKINNRVTTFLLENLTGRAVGRNGARRAASHGAHDRRSPSQLPLYVDQDHGGKARRLGPQER